MYKFIFLDLDDTILDFSAAEDAALPKALLEVGITPTEDMITRYKQINIAEWERYERGEISRDKVLTERFDILFQEFDIQLSGDVAEDAYRKYLSIGHFFVPGAVSLLDYLKMKKYRLFIASNGVAATQDSRLDSAGIRPYFDQIFISETTGYHKPEKEYFDFCFSHIADFNRAQALLIGDSLTSDIQGGKTSGIDTCWFNPSRKVAPEHLKPTYEIYSLDDLKQII